MALSGSLTFISSSVTGVHDAAGSLINSDFVGLSTFFLDRIGSYYPDAGSADNKYPNVLGANTFTDFIGWPHSIRFHEEIVSASQDFKNTSYLNTMLLGRNGPYQHPSWKQIRGGDHPVARLFRLNNTMSIDSASPDPVSRNKKLIILRHQKEKQSSNPGAATEQNYLITGEPVPWRIPNVVHFYEPSLVSKHKPFLYRAMENAQSLLGPGEAVIARASLANQFTFFSNDELNNILKISSGNPVSASQLLAYDNKKMFVARKHGAYDIIRASKTLGAGQFIYSERLYPKSINAYRGYKLKKGAYEEEAGLHSNGFDRRNHMTGSRTFWRSDQGGGGSVFSGSATSGSDRMRTDGVAVNSQHTIQDTFLKHGDRTTIDHTQMMSTRKIIDAGFSFLVPTFSGSLQPVSFIENGIVLNQQNTLSASTALGDNNLHGQGRYGSNFVQQEAYQPYQVSLLSAWPLDARQDIYSNSTHHLTSSFGGKGLHIGLTPHKAGFYTSDVRFGQPHMEAASADPANFLDGTRYDLFHQAVTASIKDLHTGSAGELVYSTKPTIFFYRTGSAVTDMDGYVYATASMQYNRHAFPYNTPFFAADRIRSREPMYNSYSDFTEDDLKYFGRDYSVLPEFKISENLEYYWREYFGGGKFKKNEELFVEEQNNYSWSIPKVSLLRRVLRKNLLGPSKSKAMASDTLKHNLRFLSLHGADTTSSFGDGLDSLISSEPRTTYYDYDPISGVQQNDFSQKQYHYGFDPVAAAFYEKYVHADNISNFTNLVQAEGAFQKGKDTIPSRIKFTCHGVQKMLPYNGFYPVLRTVQIGALFTDFLDPYIEPIGPADGTLASAVETANRKEISKQAFIEPFFGPGLLYNSIKSGIAVDFPVYTKSPYYYAPFAFVSGAHGFLEAGGRTGDGVSQGNNAGGGSSRRFHLEASQSFPYGGFQMMGSSRCIPTILNSRPQRRLPFEALYDPAPSLEPFVASKGRFFGEFFVNEALHLPSDFVDLDRFDILPGGSYAALETGPPRPGGTAPSASAYMDAEYTVSSSHPGLAQARSAILAGTGPREFGGFLNTSLLGLTTLNKTLYETSINNYLCETIEFFISDLEDSPGVKIPVAVSDPKNKDNIQINFKEKYFMDVQLRMGLDQVMCEGPRNAGMGGLKAKAGLVEGSASDVTHYQNADGTDRYPNDYIGDFKNFKMRGSLYGPPMEIIPHHTGAGYYAPGETFTGTGYGAGREGSARNARPVLDSTNGRITFRTSSVVINDYETYFGANLQDPAYQAYTPPYFYGNSSVVLEYSLGDDSDPNVQTIFEKTKNDSFYSEVYHTGSGFGHDMAGLCKTFPHTGSISSGSMTRMKIEASVDIFNDPVAVESPQLDASKTKHVWYFAPKWICPVLDFSGSLSVYKLRQELSFRTAKGKNEKKRYQWLNNSYHDTTTGQGMWGGYGTDPYDPAAYKAIRDRVIAGGNFDHPLSKDIQDKGVYFEIKADPFADKKASADVKQLAFKTEVDDDNDVSKITRGSNTSHLSSSLADVLGFEERSYEIGRFAQEKEISEAIVVIPYLEEQITLVTEGDGAHVEDDELFTTREIIPGKHFLPVHNNMFDNILSVILANRMYAENEKEYKKFLGGNIEEFESALATDVGNMIDLLLGDDSDNRKGYQLPPEFDFIHNSAVEPFQMMVIPMKAKLSKQDLIDIYQGLMPDLSRELKKITNSVEITPAGTIVDVPNWITTAKLAGGSFFNLTKGLSLANFLNADSCLIHKGMYKQLESIGMFNPDSDKQVYPGWLKSAADFYKRLNFMVFKVKARAEKDYKTYRKKQIARAVKQKINKSYQQNDAVELKLPAEWEKLLKNKKFNEVYGANWPYDYFSLIESAKIDIEIEVSE